MGALPGLQFGQDIGKVAKGFADDRRNDERFKTEQKQLGLQGEAIDAKSADLGRQQETASLDHEYGMFKRDMSTGMQAFGMDDRNYQDAVDTINQQYGLDSQVTHRVTPQGTTYDMSFTDPKTGEPVSKQGMTKQELGGMMQMSLNPSSWFDRQTARREASATAGASAAHDINKIDQKGKWDVLVASMKNKGKGTEQSLKFQKQAYKMAADAFGKLGEDGTFTFGEEYNAQYASLTSAYSATLAQSGGKGFDGDITKSHAHALRRVKDLIEVNTAELTANNPDMEEEEINAMVRDRVSDQLQALSSDIDTQGASSVAKPEERQAGITENSDEIQKMLEDAGKSAAEIRKAMGDAYVEPAAEEAAPAGLDETAPVDTDALKAPDVEVPMDVEAPAEAPAAAEEPVKREQVGDAGLAVAPVRKSKSTGTRSSMVADKQDTALAGKITKQRDKEPISTGTKKLGQNAMITSRSGKMQSLRDEAYKRYQAGSNSPIIIQAAINSGKLKGPELKQAEALMTEYNKKNMVAGK